MALMMFRNYDIAVSPPSATATVNSLGQSRLLGHHGRLPHHPQVQDPRLRQRARQQQATKEQKRALLSPPAAFMNSTMPIDLNTHVDDSSNPGTSVGTEHERIKDDAAPSF